MNSPARLKAEEKFSQLKRQHKNALKEREKAQHEVSSKIARLRALRLAKEAADQEAAEKAPTKPKKARRKRPD